MMGPRLFLLDRTLSRPDQQQDKTQNEESYFNYAYTKGEAGAHIQSNPVLKWLIRTGFSVQPGLPKNPQLESVLDWIGIFAPLLT